MSLDFLQALSQSADSKTGLVTAQKIEQAAGRYLQAMNKLNPTQAKLFDQMTGILRSAENGNERAIDELATVQKKLVTEKARLSKSIFYKFVKENENGIGLISDGDVGSRAKQIFSSATDSDDLMEAAVGNQEAISAIESQYLRQLEENLMTSRPISGTGTGEFVNEPSLVQLRKQNGKPNAANGTPAAVRDIILKNNPKVNEVVDILLKELEGETAAKQLRIQNNSSSTMPDTTRANAISAMVTLTFGFMTKAGHVARKVINFGTANADQNTELMKKEFIPRILGNAQEFSDAVDRYIADPSKRESIVKQFGRVLITNSNIHNTTKAVVGANKPEANYDDTEQALGSTNKANLGITGGQLAESTAGPMLEAFSKVPMNWKGREQSTNIEDRRVKK